MRRAGADCPGQSRLLLTKQPMAGGNLARKCADFHRRVGIRSSGRSFLPSLRRGLPEYGLPSPAGRFSCRGQRNLSDRRPSRRPHPAGIPLQPHHRRSGQGVGPTISGAGPHPQGGSLPGGEHPVRLARLPHGPGLGRDRGQGCVHRDAGGGSQGTDRESGHRPVL